MTLFIDVTKHDVEMSNYIWRAKPFGLDKLRLRMFVSIHIYIYTWCCWPEEVQASSLSGGKRTKSGGCKREEAKEEV